MSTWLTDPEIETFRELMVMNTLRGSEGAGIVAVGSGQKQPIHVLKTDASGADLVMSAPFYKLMQTRRKLIVGHCRLPTRGTTALDDIHPHKVEHISGVHNGTLWQLNGKAIPDKASDSLELFKSFVEIGVIERQVEMEFCGVLIEESAVRFGDGYDLNVGAIPGMGEEAVSVAVDQAGDDYPERWFGVGGG